MSPKSLDDKSIVRAAKKLAKIDPALAKVLKELGPPSLWKRPANFSTFVRIILDQQVSLAAGKSIFNRVRAACDGRITAAKILLLSADELRALGLSRQKARYVLTLADDVRAKRFLIGSLKSKSDDEARKSITSRLGLGDWSADVYLMSALSRPDLFPVGDLALIKGMTMLDGGKYDTPEKALKRAERWRPFRSVATRMIWQLYLSK